VSKALASSIAVELASASTAPRLTNREVGGFALRGLALGARQGGANQAPVNRTVILDLSRAFSDSGFSFSNCRKQLAASPKFVVRV
jgi:hypothetical protein